MAQGKALTPEDKKAIVSLKEYFDRTKEDIEEQANSKRTKGSECAWIRIGDSEKQQLALRFPLTSPM